MDVTVIIDGVSYVMQPVAAPAPAPLPAPAPVVLAPASLPLSWSAPQFANNVIAPSTRIANGGTLKNKSITDTGSTASVVTGDGATIQNVRINSREGIRIGGSGNFLIDGCYVEVNGVGSDHADGVQAYAPGSKGVITVRNSLFKTGGSATAGFFIADNWTGDVDISNTVFQEGPFGLRLHADVGGDINVSLQNVFFVGAFQYKPLYFLNYGGGRVVIKKWENVREATIVNGVLVPGKLITA